MFKIGRFIPEVFKIGRFIPEIRFYSAFFSIAVDSRVSSLYVTLADET